MRFGGAQDGNIVHFKIKRKTVLKKLMEAYCQRQSLQLDQCVPPQAKPVRSTRPRDRSLPQSSWSAFSWQALTLTSSTTPMLDPFQLSVCDPLCPQQATNRADPQIPRKQPVPAQHISGSARGAQAADAMVVRRIRFLFDGARLRDNQTPGADPPPLRTAAYPTPQVPTHSSLRHIPNTARGTQQPAQKHARVAGVQASCSSSFLPRAPPHLEARSGNDASRSPQTRSTNQLGKRAAQTSLPPAAPLTLRVREAAAF